MSKIAILKYTNSVNLHSVLKAFKKFNDDTKVVENISELSQYDKIVLPGVGAFPDAMKSIGTEKDALIKQIESKPTLGICLGMQILADLGLEGEEESGLGIVSGEVKKVEVNGSVPHMGWAGLEILNESPILKGISKTSQFYFMHSYEFCNYANLSTTSQYCGHHFVSSIRKGNIFGVQFHPEKSREAGLLVIQNFINYEGL